MQSTPVQVLKYLSERKIEHGEYHKDAMAGNFILATVPDSRWGWTTTNCLIIFQFDNNDRLMRTDVSEDHEGP